MKHLTHWLYCYYLLQQLHLKNKISPTATYEKQNIDIPTIFFTASFIMLTRALLSTHRLASTWGILLTRLVLPISNSFPNWWVASRFPRIFKLPCLAPSTKQPRPSWNIWFLTREYNIIKNEGFMLQSQLMAPMAKAKTWW